MVLSGEVQVTSEHGRFTLNRRDYYDIPESGARLVNSGESMAELARIQGHWEHTVRQEICMFDAANPCDIHYHDGDEYWMVFRGHFNIDYNGLKIPTRRASCWCSARATSMASKSSTRRCRRS